MLELVRHLTRHTSHHVSLICLSDHVEYDYVYQLPIDFCVLGRKTKKDPSVFFKLLRIIKKQKPDIIHSWSSMANIYSLPIAKMLGVKFITSVIADSPKNLTYRNKAYFRARLVFPFADKITSNSLAGLKAYKAPAQKSICIYNGFDDNRLSSLEEKADLKQQLGIQHETIVGMVAGFETRKDYATFINAARQVLASDPQTVFLLIGDGHLRNEMMQLVPEDQNRNIRFLGKIHNVESYINLFDIAVLCTNTDVHQEGISNAILEYMALQKPVIATEGGGTNEIVVDGKTGFLIPPFNPGILAERMRELIRNPAMRTTMGRNGADRIRDAFSIEKMCTRFYSLYDEVLQD